MAIVDDRFSIIAGPCQPESADHALRIARHAAATCGRLGLGYVFKTSFLKANRTDLAGEAGPGIAGWREIVTRVREEVGCLVTTDVHETWQVEQVADLVEIVQIPALLSKQTALIVAAGRTGLVVNIKKGQFMSASEALKAAEKARWAGAREVYVTDRGSSFGRGDLVNDFAASIAIVQSGQPLLFDATHSAQKPGQRVSSSGGDRRFVPGLVRAALAIGASGIFMEVHESPEQAWSDSKCQLDLDQFDAVAEMSAAFLASTAALQPDWTELDRKFFSEPQ